MLKPMHATMILSNTFACSMAILDRPTGIAASFKKISWSDLDNTDQYKTLQSAYLKNNHFIKDFGVIKLFGNPNKHIFVNYAVPPALKQSELYNIAICYGSKANFNFRIKNETASAIIRPIIHFFPSKIVNIIYSCNIYAKDTDALLQIMEQLKLSNDKMYKIPFICEKSQYDDISCLKELTLRIRRNIEHSIPVYHFDEVAVKKRHCYVYLDPEEPYNGQEFKDFCCSLKKIDNSYVNKDNMERHLSQSDEDHFFLMGDWSVYYNSIYEMSYWSFYKLVEYIIIGGLTLEFVELISKQIMDDIHKEKTKISLNFLKVNYYNQDFEEMVKDYIDTMNHDNSYIRMLVYMYYGGKEKFKERFTKFKETYQTMVEKIESRDTIYKIFLKKIFGL